MKLDETVFVSGDELNVHICDQCDERTNGRPYLYWPERDFTLCDSCLEKSYDLMFRRPHESSQNYSKKKLKIPAKLKQSVFERDRYRCRYCGSHKNLTADHVFPESRGGEAIFDNLVTACSDCNTRKGARTPEEAGMIIKDISR